MIKGKKNSIIRKLKELSAQIERHNYLYHNLDKPQITDSEYDNLVKENNELEKNYPSLILKSSPNKLVGSKIKSRFQKVKHLSQMYSLGNAI